MRMRSAYEKIIRENLAEVFDDPSGEERAEWTGAEKEDTAFRFRAFGRECRVSPEGIRLAGLPATGPEGVIISLYLRHAHGAGLQMEPFRAFKDLKGSMPYQGAFSANAERVLVPHVPRIAARRGEIVAAFDGHDGPEEAGGDLSFVLYPLPKIALCYVFYLPDEEFPASATCLFSANADMFMPLDGLADTAEYTSRRIIALLGTGED
ncbi:MAG: hypothetical protein DRH56_08710 [Deltaproteobacteria bacterium]|nr:MAG: hypothetical protein DRH56_08710 [Deltaproteobacteria bacterium]